ncbi:hypothetical protein HY085_03225 [Candidatus Gottesmanbacteria bacterium]|nr:hypothetical protein [Candidatus Gottesmanbacteria bacterium]
MSRINLQERFIGFIKDPLGNKRFEAKLQTYAHNSVHYGNEDVRTILAKEDFNQASQNLTLRIIALSLTATAAVVGYGLFSRPPH